MRVEGFARQVLVQALVAVAALVIVNHLRRRVPALRRVLEGDCPCSPG